MGVGRSRINCRGIGCMAGLAERLPILITIIVAAAAMAILLAGTGAGAAEQPGPTAAPGCPTRLHVVTDDNYPPYVFRDEGGELRGILPDQWRLWERRTGIAVDLDALDWALAQQMMLNGAADVIDTIFFTPERARIYAFSRPYAEIPVSVFHHESISGIPDSAALRGFTVAVKEGDACVEVLRQQGVTSLVPYPSYEAIIRDAARGTVKIFCIDDPPAHYFLAKYRLTREFRQGFSLYSGQFHRAVHKDRIDLLQRVEQGFAAIPKGDLEAVDRRWLGRPLLLSEYSPYLPWALGGLGLLIVLVFGWNLGLKQAVRRKTQELAALLAISHEREALLRITFQSMGDGVITTDASGAVKQMNLAAQDLTGWSEEDAAGRPIVEVFRILNEHSREPVADPVARVLAEGRVVGLANHTVLLARNGVERPIADSAAPILDDAGGVVGCVLVFRDRSEERQAQEAARAAMERLELALEGARLGAWDWDIAQHRVVRSDRWAEMLGYDPQTIGTDPEVWRRALHPDDRSRVLRLLFAHLRGETPYFTAEYRLRNAAGNWVWVLDRGRVIAFGPNGQPLRAAGVNMDITAWKETETRLRLLTRAVEQNPASIIITDPTGAIEYVNAAFCTLTGYLPTEVVGRDPRFLKSGQTPAEEYVRLRAAMAAGHEWRGTFCNRKKDGTFYWDQAVISPIKDSQGRITHFLGVQEDLTEKKSLQEQLVQAQKLESIGRLAGGVAHDFNNALQIILGYAELGMAAAEFDSRLHGLLSEIHQAALRSAAVVRQLLAFARKQAIQPVAINLNDTVQETRNMLQRLVGEDLRLEWRPGPDLWPVLMDPSQVDQLLANLVVNARDAVIDTGTITIETENLVLDGSRRAGPVSIPSGDYVRLSVIDTGRGMDGETLEHIFEPFFTTKEVGKGTGLGLSTVYGIVKQNGGWIDVTSAPAAGTRFDIFLPRLRSDSVVEQGVLDQPARPTTAGRETVLLVEDENLILSFTRSVLEQHGYRVHAFDRPETALKWTGTFSGTIDLLITDVVMPGMNGRELQQRLQAQYPAMRCLFMSGYTADVTALRGIEADGIHFLAKPFSVETLVRKVRETLA